jgi:anti-sigma-K factor RskA
MILFSQYVGGREKAPFIAAASMAQWRWEDYDVHACLLWENASARSYMRENHRCAPSARTERVQEAMTAFGRDMGETRCDEVIAGEYVLGALSQEDCRKVEARLASDRRFAAMVGRWQETLLTFSDDTPPHATPGVGLRGGRQVLHMGPCDAVFTGKVSGGCWNSLGFWRGLAFAGLAVAAGLVLSLGGLLTQRPVGAGRLVSDAAGEGAAIDHFVHYEETNGALRLTPVSDANEKKRALEVWLKKEGEAPVSLGVLPHKAGSALILSRSGQPPEK